MCHYSINGNATEGMCDIISVQSTEGNFSFVEQHLIDGQMPKNQLHQANIKMQLNALGTLSLNK